MEGNFIYFLPFHVSNWNKISRFHWICKNKFLSTFQTFENFNLLKNRYKLLAKKQAWHWQSPHRWELCILPGQTYHDGGLCWHDKVIVDQVNLNRGSFELPQACAMQLLDGPSCFLSIIYLKHLARKKQYRICFQKFRKQN